MQKIVFFFALFINISAFCQADSSTMDAAAKKNIEDSISAVLNQISGSTEYTPSGIDTSAENANSGLDYFTRLEEREKAEKRKTAPLKIITGILLLGIFTIILTIKKKNKESRS